MLLLAVSRVHQDNVGDIAVSELAAAFAGRSQITLTEALFSREQWRSYYGVDLL